MQSTLTLFLAFCPLLASVSVAETPPEPDPPFEPQFDPLFESHEPLEITISGPFTTLMRERPDEEELDGTASWTEVDGTEVEVSVQLRTRGNYRRDESTCPFAPLRLDFRGSEVEGTLFDKQDKLKLVTHCRERSVQYEQLLIREYVTYRLLNVLTDISYRVRLLRVTYQDIESNRADRLTWAFVIEHKDRFDNRTGLDPLDVERTSLSALDPEFTNLTSIFQYMIGNTDFSPISAPEGASCCHNTHPFAVEGGPVHSVPYDFDMSGIINAPYAAPNPRFGLRDVRQRLYRGRCRFNDHLPATIEHFQNSREALYAVVAEATALSPRNRRSMERYLDSFFKTLDDERAVERRLTGACIGPR
ncbi:MAG: hypothetical protein QNI99_07205 [Woeseiaceae bacterium]|nr:hypothetical protein [Woeseiaceae bacterium]